MVHSNALQFLDKHSLQYAAFFIVDRTSELAISESNASEIAGNDWDAVWSITSIGVPEVFFVEAHGLKVDPLFSAITPDLWYERGFSRWFWAFGSVRLIRLDDISSSRSRRTLPGMRGLAGLHHSYSPSTHTCYGGSRRLKLQWRLRLEYTPHTRLYTGVLLSPILRNTGPASRLTIAWSA